MNWKLMVAVGTAVGTVVWATRRRAVNPPSDAGVWAAATDPVAGSCPGFLSVPVPCMLSGLTGPSRVTS